jgi:tetratricopeptide (TPR) repeat protein
MKYLLPLLILAACSSAPEKKPAKSPENVSNSDFKKEKPLKNSQITDFYQGSANSLSPALADETTDRYTPEELNQLSTSGDPLMDISIRCLKGDYKNAFQVASQNFTKYQKVAAYWNQVANCHLNSGNFRKALLFYNKALEVNPDYVPALNNIGVMYSRQGLDQKALVAFERANKQSKFSKTPRYNLARLYLTYGMADTAQPIFQSLLNESPNDVDLLNATATSYFLLSDYQKALSLYQSIPRAHWKRAEIGLNVSITLKKTGKPDDARKVFNAVEVPKSGNLKRYYSSVEAQLGDG